MANQDTRKKGKAKPLTANPLFPAVVALWCGAALGVPSLAIGPSALESLVIKSRIDLIVPAAAPPLGLTARILFALALAVIGATIGMVVARRIARPRTEPKERKRNARASAAEPALRTRDKHPDAPVRRPISAHEELGETIAQQPAAPGALGNRRRALAIIEEPAQFVPEIVAPLPGGEPQILDLAGAELEQAPVTALNAPAFSAAPTEEGDLNDYADPAPNDDDAQQIAQPVAEEAPAPVLAMDVDRQVFHANEPAHPIDAGRQVFGMGPVEPVDEANRQIFGTAAATEDAAAEIIKAAGYQMSVFDAEPAAPLFSSRRDQGALSQPAPTVATEETSPTVAETAIAPAAAAEPLPPITGLGMTDLAVRLQESMRRRRAARAATQPLPETQDVQIAPPAPEAPSAQPLAEAVAETPLPNDELPAALRPISFDDDDDDALPSVLPPRAIFNPARLPDAFYPAAPIPAPVEDSIDQPVADLHEEPADEAANEAHYGSLLEIAPPEPRTSFVRVEEPQPLGEAIEPVVIFPGQAQRVPLAVSSLPRNEAAPFNEQADSAENGSFRRFDAPSSASAGQAVSANPAAPTVDRDEAERALRAALSSLQRISGAA